MPYLWRNPDDYPDELDGEYDEEQSPDYSLFRRAMPWPPTEKVPIVRFRGSADLLLQFHFLPNSTRIPLVSQEVLKTLKRFCPADIEGVSANVLAKDRMIAGFSFLNVVGQVHAIDMERSDYVLIKGTNHPRKFNRLVLRRDALEDHHFARDLNYASYIFTSDEAKVLFESAGWKGCAFIRPEDVHS